MEKPELIYKDEYTPEEIELLAIIGEAYLNLGTPDERYFRRQIQKVLDYWDSLPSDDEDDEDEFDWND